MRSTFVMAMALAAAPLIASQTVEDSSLEPKDYGEVAVLGPALSLWQLVEEHLQALDARVGNNEAKMAGLSRNINREINALKSEVDTLD